MVVAAAQSGCEVAAALHSLPSLFQMNSGSLLLLAQAVLNSCCGLPAGPARLLMLQQPLQLRQTVELRQSSTDDARLLPLHHLRHREHNCLVHERMQRPRATSLRRVRGN